MMSSAKIGKKARLFLVIGACVSVAALILILFFDSLIGAWFQSTISVDNPALLSNFETKVFYAFEGGAESLLSADEAISVTPDTVEQLQFRVEYRGESAAYLRVRVQSEFYNTISGTRLPQTEDLLALSNSSTKWCADNGYLYYTERLGDNSQTNGSTVPSGTTVTAPATVFSPLDGVFSLSADFSALMPSERQQYEGQLYVMVEAVQPDRYPEFWNLSTLPF